MDVNTVVDNFDAVIDSHGSGLLAKMSAAYKDPEFLNDYEKITGDAPFTPDEFDEVLKKFAGSTGCGSFQKNRGHGPLSPH